MIYSRLYRPAMACERCVFGTGEHAEWCGKPVVAGPCGDICHTEAGSTEPKQGCPRCGGVVGSYDAGVWMCARCLIGVRLRRWAPTYP